MRVDFEFFFYAFKTVISMPKKSENSLMHSLEIKIKKE